MKQKLFIFLGLAILIFALIGLNAVSFSQKEKQPDSEMSPNRSTFNAGITGTRAFYDLLAETGRRPMRWQEPPAALLTENQNSPAAFVVIGELRNEFTDEEAAQLLKWVSAGGILVVIDRSPPDSLVKTTANWNLSFKSDFRRPLPQTDASDQAQMTAGLKAGTPIQPTVYTKSINGVQPSVFAASINFEYFGEPRIEERASSGTAGPAPTFSAPRHEANEQPPKAFPTGNRAVHTREPAANAEKSEENAVNKIVSGEVRIDKAAEKQESSVVSEETVDTAALDAPVVHLAAGNRNLLVEAPYGSGKIVYLSDPYIVSNGGINLVDNAQLALNITASSGGITAFDEYHQGYGSQQNRLLQYFAGTPVVPIMLQISLLIGLLFFSQSRRFARPLPEREPNRLAKLEYVSAMAELQQRTKAYDLAIENIYTDFRRRVSKLVGVDNFTTRREELARLIGERLPGENAAELEELVRKCEDVMHGERTNKKEVLRLTSRLREIEEKLGLQRRQKAKAKR